MAALGSSCSSMGVPGQPPSTPWLTSDSNCDQDEWSDRKSQYGYAKAKQVWGQTEKMA